MARLFSALTRRLRWPVGPATDRDLVSVEELPMFGVTMVRDGAGALVDLIIHYANKAGDGERRR